MKLSCLQENLKAGLNTVRPALSKRSTLPITNNILLTTDGGRLKLTTYNLEYGISRWIGAKVTEEGAITLPGELLIDFIASLDDGLTEISTLPKTHITEISHKRQIARVSGIDAKEYPPLPSIKDGRILTFDAASLKEALDYTQFAAHREYDRPVLGGVNIRTKEQEVTFAGADGFRLSTYKLTPVNHLDQPLDITVPLGAAERVVMLIGDQTDPVDLVVGVKQRVVIFRLKDTEVVSNLIEGTFPNYEQIIPQEFQRKVTVKVKELAMAVRLSGIINRRATEGVVRMETSAGVALISSRDLEDGDTENYVTATLVGDEGKIAFREKFMREILDRAGESEIIMQTNAPSSPMMVHIPGKDTFSYLVMPMFVTW